MTIGEIIHGVEKLRPGCKMSLSEFLFHINRLEEEIHKNLVKQHKQAYDFKEHTDESEKVYVPDIYAELFKFWLTAIIDLNNGDITRYTNNMILYNNMISSYYDWYNRNYMPVQRARLRWC